jgi:4-amino-4-deoxy-L-arabinose transferase-like glycosyltransferase
MIKNINTKFLILFSLIVVSFLLRLISSYFYGDTKWEGEPTEWGILVHHLTNYNSYSLYRFGDLLAPSVYMPPGYPILLYLLKIISFDVVNFIKLVIFFQIILSTYSVYVFYQLNLNLFSEKLSLINASIFSIFPLNIYVSGQISSITLQFLLSLLFLQFLLLIIKKQTTKNIIFFSLISGLLILTRGEFVLVFFSIILLCLFFKNIKLINLLKIILIVSLVISPYVIRNYLHFNQLILVKSLGFNLWKGNNELSSVQGYEDYENFEFQELKSKLDNLEQNKYYELNRDQIFLDEAKKELIQNPTRYLYLYFKKFLSYYFIDLNSTYPKYYNFFHIFPVTILSILSFPGLFIFLKKKNTNYNYLSLYLFLNLMIFSIFFILPRYKLIIFPIQIILAAGFIKYILNKLNKQKL